MYKRFKRWFGLKMKVRRVLRQHAVLFDSGLHIIGLQFARKARSEPPEALYSSKNIKLLNMRSLSGFIRSVLLLSLPPNILFVNGVRNEQKCSTLLLTNGGIIKCFSATNVYTIARELDLSKIFNAYKELCKFLPVTPMESHEGLLVEKLVNGVSLNKVDVDIR